MMTKRLIVLTHFLCAAPALAGGVLFVDDDAPDKGDGQSWDTAYRFLQDALVFASDPANGVTEIRVAQGAYKPDRDEANPGGTEDREATFELIADVALMGGYAGLGAEDPDARDAELFVTTLTADLWDNDLATIDIWHPSLAENSLHVAVAENVDSAAILDGFTIEGGLAHEGGGFPHERGGGILLLSSTPTIRNCVFVGNKGSSAGGGIMVWEPPVDLAIENCVFMLNSASDGGGIDHQGGGALTVTNCVFEENVARSADGGAIHSQDSTLDVADCEFVGNVAGIDVAGDGGAVNVRDGNARITSCTFTENESSTGAAVYCKNADDVDIIGCSFSNNLGTRVAVLYVEDCEAVLLINSQFTGNLGGGFGDDSSEPLVIGCAFIQHPAAGVDVESDAVFIDCVFEDNSGESTGGGARFRWDATLVGCEFSNNDAPFAAGGLYLLSGTVVSCVFYNNTCGTSGGGLSGAGEIQIFNCLFRQNAAATGGAVSNAEPLTMTNSVCVGNTADFGGAVHFADSLAEFSNCTIAGNTATMLGGGIYNEEFAAVSIRNSIFWDNSDAVGVGEESQVTATPDSVVAIDYSCIHGWTGAFGGIGNIGDNPLFVDGDGLDDIYGTDDDDLQLQSGSPCIDAGFNNAVPTDTVDIDEDDDTAEFIPIDFLDNARFADDRDTPDNGCGVPVVVDMGAFEFAGAVSQPVRGDVDGDLHVGSSDLILLLGAWGSCEACCLADLNADGVVDPQDLVELLGNWGQGER